MRYLGVLLLLLMAPAAQALIAEGNVRDNRHDDNGYSFEIITTDGKQYRVLYGEDEPGQVCVMGIFYKTALKLTPDERVRVVVPDTDLKKLPDGSQVYYLCDEGSLLTLLP